MLLTRTHPRSLLLIAAAGAVFIGGCPSQNSSQPSSDSADSRPSSPARFSAASIANAAARLDRESRSP
jgi:hypothetical protein